MITLSLVSLLIGAALGQYYRVLALIPATAVLLVLAIGTGVAQAQTAWSIVLMVAAAATSVQIGYLVGLTVHHVVAANWSGGTSALTSSTSTSAR
jgi:membrane protein DedA with SNARE-associated domain